MTVGGTAHTSGNTFTWSAAKEVKSTAAIINYTITYNLDGGNVSTANPTTYNVTTATFSLTNPTKAGYEFLGWTGSNGTTPQTTVSITKGSTGNKTYTANWSAITSTPYKVQHWQQKLTGSVTPQNSTNYTLVDTDNLQGTTDASVTPAVKTTYTGFTAPATQTVTISGEGTTIVNYYYTRNSHTVTLNKGTGIDTVTGAGTYLYGANVTINATVKTGYTWNKWTGDEANTTQNYTFTMPDSDITNTANATVHKLTIQYNMNGGSLASTHGSTVSDDGTYVLLNSSRTIHTINYGESLPSGGLSDLNSASLINLEKIGYHIDASAAFNTKADGTGDTFNQTTAYAASDFDDISSGNKTIVLYANWKANTDTPYKVQHWQQKLTGSVTPQNDTNYTLKDTDNLTGTTAASVTPAVKTTYTGFTAPNTQTVTIAADGKTVVNYYYTRNSYDVTLNKGTGIDTVTGAGSYLYEAQVSIDATVKTGYTWNKWTGDKETTTKAYTFTMPAANVTNTANATRDNYSIDYTLDGGTVSPANPTSYHVETDTFTLNNPTKTGYTFIGWTGSNGTTPQTTVSITKGSTGDKSFVANYTANTNTPYKVQHWQQKLTGDKDVHDSTNYRLVDTDNLTGTTAASVTPAVKTTYTGFTAPDTQTITIAADGSTILNYYYTRNSYTVTLNKGTGIDTVTGAGTYLFEASVTINATVKDGYTWKDWTGNKATTTRAYTFTMPAADVTNTANTNRENYSITYDLDGGTVSPANLTSYHVETETFTLNNPTKTGYTFIGWTGSNGTTPQTTVSIAKGSTGNKNYTANYTANTYTINYNGNGGNNSSK